MGCRCQTVVRVLRDSLLCRCLISVDLCAYCRRGNLVKICKLRCFFFASFYCMLMLYLLIFEGERIFSYFRIIFL